MSSAQGIRAGKAFVEVVAVNRFTKTFDEAEARIRDFGVGLATDGIGRVFQGASARLRMFSDGLRAAGRLAAMPGLAIVAPMAAATASFKAFDDQMRLVGALAGGTESQFRSLTATAEHLGRTTSFTAAQVAALMTELARGGMDTSQIDAATKSVLDLARASDTEAATAAEIMIATLNQFGLTASHSSRIADVLAVSANRTAASVSGLGESLKYAGTVAASMGVGVEEATAVLGVLANFGIKGSDAGTTLRRLILLTTKESEKLRELYGVNNRDASGNLRDFASILDEIGQSNQGLGNVDAMQKIEETFGILGSTGAVVLTQNADAVRQLAAALKGAGGEAAATASAMDDGIGGAMRRVVSALEGVANLVGSQLSSSLVALADIITSVITKTTEWLEANEGIILSVAAFGAACLAASVVLGTLGAALGIAATAVGGLLAVIVLTVGAAIAAKIAMIKWGIVISHATIAASALNATLGVTAFMMGVVAKANSAMSRIMVSSLNPIKTMKGLLSLLVVSFKAVKFAGVSAWSVVLAPLLVVAAKAVAIAAVIGGIGAMFVTAAKRAGIAGQLFGGLGARISQFAEIFKTAFTAVSTAITSGQYGTAVKVLWSGIKAAFWTGLQGIVDALANVLAVGIDGAKKFGESLLSILWEVFKSIPSIIWNSLTGMKSLAEVLHDALQGNMPDMYGGLDRMAKASREELAMTAKQAADTADAINRISEQESKLAKLREQHEAARISMQPDAPQRQDKLRDGATEEQQARYAAINTEIERLERSIQAFEAATGKNTADMADRLEKEKERAAAAENTESAINDRIAALKRETTELELGVEAAERLALAQSGATEAQLKAYDAAIATRDMAEVSNAIRERTESLEAERREIEIGSAAAARYALAMQGATSEQLRALDAAQKARDDADAARKLESDGMSLRESLRSPLQVFRDELAEFYKLRNAGAIDDETHSRARERSRETLLKEAENEEMRQKIRQEEMRRLQRAVDAGHLNPDAAQRSLDYLSAMLDEAARRASDAGSRMTRLAEGTADGFALARTGATGRDDTQARIARATQDQLEETRRMHRTLQRQTGPRFQ